MAYSGFRLATPLPLTVLADKRSGTGQTKVLLFVELWISSHPCCARNLRGPYKRKSETGKTPINAKMIPPGFAAIFTLCLLAKPVVAAPSVAPRSDLSVSVCPYHCLISPLNVFEISWGNCESYGVTSTDPNFQCGYFQVPMGYHDGPAGNARLAVIKYAATAKRTGSFFFNPGS